MKKISLILLTIFMFLVITGCGDSCDHTWCEWKTLKNPTCLEDGQKEHTCSTCEKVEKKSIQKLGHSFGVGYAKNAEGHYHFCELCGYEESLETHSEVENELGNIRCSTCEYLISENTNSFYDNLLKINKNFIIELKKFEITEELSYVHNNQLIMGHRTYLANGRAIFMDTENGINILVQGDLVGENFEGDVLEEGNGHLEAVMDGENIYFKLNLNDTTYDYTEFYSCKADVDFIMNMLLSNAGIDESILQEGNSNLIKAFPNILNNLFNLSNNELIQLIVDFLFIKEESNDGYTLTFDLNKLVDFINSITNKPVNSIFDKIFGDGKYEISKKNVIKLLDAKISNLLKMMKVKYDLDIKQIMLDICEMQGFDSSEVEFFFNDKELMNKSIIEIICEEEEMSRDEVFEEIDNLFKELETEVIIINKTTSKEILNVINLINDSIDLVISTDKAGYIQNIDLCCDFVIEEDYNVNGNLTIREYLNEEEFNEAKVEIIKMYEETIPTMDWDKVPNDPDKIVSITDTSISFTIKEKHYDYRDLHYTGSVSYVYYYEYISVTFDFEDILGITIDNSSNPTMANWDSHLYIDVVGLCSGATAIDGQLYYEDGREAYYDYSLNDNQIIRDQLYQFNIFYDSNYECVLIDVQPLY